MNLRSIAILILCASLAVTVLAQTGDEEIGGAGTPNFIAKFLSTHKIGNSNIFQSPGGSVGIGLTTPTDQFEVHSDSVIVPTNRFGPAAIFTEATGNVTGTAGIRAHASSSSGNTFGVDANAFSPNGTGVIGQGGENGVIGMTGTTSGFATGVRGSSNGTSGPGVGVFGEAWSAQGIAGLFINRPGGDIIHGAVSQNPDITVFRVDGTGRVFADGGFQPNGADFAESMAVTGNRSKYVPGDLLVIDQTANRRLALAHKPYSTLVAGIYSTKPGMLGSAHRIEEKTHSDEVPLAVVGIVPCKVSAENGPVQAGDLLVSSSTPGHAMKGTDRSKMLGAVVGKALEPLLDGTGIIQVLVTLQ
jgi:hypothetical protein